MDYQPAIPDPGRRRIVHGPRPSSAVAWIRNPDKPRITRGPSARTGHRGSTACPGGGSFYPCHAAVRRCSSPAATGKPTLLQQRLPAHRAASMSRMLSRERACLQPRVHAEPVPPEPRDLRRRSGVMKRSYFSNARLASIAWVLFAIAVGTPPVARAEGPRMEEALPALRVQVDAPRNLAWVLNRDAVYVYDLPKKTLIKRIELPGWLVAGEAFSRGPDLALAPTGAALVTSNVVPTIWEINPEDLTVRQHRLSLDADLDKDVGFTGLAFGPDGRDLIGTSSVLESTWKIDLAAGTAHKLRVSSTGTVATNTRTLP